MSTNSSTFDPQRQQSAVISSMTSAMTSATFGSAASASLPPIRTALQLLQTTSSQSGAIANSSSAVPSTRAAESSTLELSQTGRTPPPAPTIKTRTLSPEGTALLAQSTQATSGDLANSVPSSNRSNSSPITSPREQTPTERAAAQQLEKETSESVDIANQSLQEGSPPESQRQAPPTMLGAQSADSQGMTATSSPQAPAYVVTASLRVPEAMQNQSTPSHASSLYTSDALSPPVSQRQAPPTMLGAQLAGSQSMTGTSSPQVSPYVVTSSLRAPEEMQNQSTPSHASSQYPTFNPSTRPSVSVAAVQPPPSTPMGVTMSREDLTQQLQALSLQNSTETAITAMTADAATSSDSASSTYSTASCGSFSSAHFSSASAHASHMNPLHVLHPNSRQQSQNTSQRHSLSQPQTQQLPQEGVLLPEHVSSRIQAALARGSITLSTPPFSTAFTAPPPFHTSSLSSSAPTCSSHTGSFFTPASATDSSSSFASSQSAFSTTSIPTFSTASAFASSAPSFSTSVSSAQSNSTTQVNLTVVMPPSHPPTPNSDTPQQAQQSYSQPAFTFSSFSSSGLPPTRTHGHTTNDTNPVKQPTHVYLERDQDTNLPNVVPITNLESDSERSDRRTRSSGDIDLLEKQQAQLRRHARLNRQSRQKNVHQNTEYDAKYNEGDLEIERQRQQLERAAKLKEAFPALTTLQLTRLPESATYKKPAVVSEDPYVQFVIDSLCIPKTQKILPRIRMLLRKYCNKNSTTYDNDVPIQAAKFYIEDATYEKQHTRESLVSKLCCIPSEKRTACIQTLAFLVAADKTADHVDENATVATVENLYNVDADFVAQVLTRSMLDHEGSTATTSAAQPSQAQTVPPSGCSCVIM